MKFSGNILTLCQRVSYCNRCKRLTYQILHLKVDKNSTTHFIWYLLCSEQPSACFMNIMKWNHVLEAKKVNIFRSVSFSHNFGHLSIYLSISAYLHSAIPSGIPLFWKQASQTLTGARPQPLSGTGRVLEEQPSQKPSPQARQWCFVSLSWNSTPQFLHLWKKFKCFSEDFSSLKKATLKWPSIKTHNDERIGLPVSRGNLVC